MDNADRQIVTVERALQPGESEATRAPSGKGGQELQRLHRLMRGRYWIAILLSLILAAGGAYLGFRSGGKTYQSTGMLRVQAILPKILYPVEEHGMLPAFDLFVDAQVALIRSQRIMEAALDDPSLKSALLQHPADGSGSLEVFQNSIDVQSAGGLITIKSVNADRELARLAVAATMKAYLDEYTVQDAKNRTARKDSAVHSYRPRRSNWMGSPQSSAGSPLNIIPMMFAY